MIYIYIYIYHKKLIFPFVYHHYECRNRYFPPQFGVSTAVISVNYYVNVFFPRHVSVWGGDINTTFELRLFHFI